MRLMSVTRDTSQVPIAPCGPFEHLPFGDSLRHASTALLSCTLDRGENAGCGQAGLSSNYRRRFTETRSFGAFGLRQGQSDMHVQINVMYSRAPLHKLDEILVKSIKETMQRRHRRQNCEC